MADKDSEGDGPSLELPSFGFGRRKKAKPAEATPAPVEETLPAPLSEPLPTPRRPAAPTPEPTPAPAPDPPPPARKFDPVIPEPAPVVPTQVLTRVEPAVESAVEPEAAERKPRREFSLPSLPALPALQAALVVGALIGLLAVLLTFASLKLCELVRGTDSCGGPGLLLLVATLVILTYVGAWLLRGFGIDDPGSTSFLAVGLLAVMTMVFFLDVIYNWWMLIVIPLVGMGTYALSWWVTTTFVDID